MLENWENAVVSHIGGALYVPVGYGKAVHTDRINHGFVLNEEGSIKDYVFSDGRVMRTEGQALFYPIQKLVCGKGGIGASVQPCLLDNGAHLGHAPHDLHFSARFLAQFFDGVILSRRAVHTVNDVLAN